MAGFEARPGEGYLFKNDRKPKKGEEGYDPESKLPDYTGNGCCPHCSKEFRTAGWSNQSKDKTKNYIKFKYTDPNARNGATTAKKPVDTPIDDDINF